jgi:DNA invertase Pin-like site-specific DNA recombinase
MTIYAYVRVSTEKQSGDNQRYEIANFAQREAIVIDTWIEEKISATTELGKRKLGKLISKIGTGDLIIASELSRLGRNLLQVMAILHRLLNSGAVVRTLKDNYQLGADIHSKVLAFAFGLAAEIERDLISQRTAQALAARRAAGVTLGRPSGRKNVNVKLSGHEPAIRRYLAQGDSHATIARKLDVHRQTLANFLRRH